MATVNIKGMSCQHCVKSTREALEQIPGIKNIKVDLENGKAHFDGDIALQEVKNVIEKIGFEII